jgi:hypothetical protein
MNRPVNDPRHPWSRLTSSARQLNDDRDTSAPYGFATRIVAIALAQEEKMGSLFDRFALRAVSVSCVLALCSVALNYGLVTNSPAPTSVVMANLDEVMIPTPDTVAVVFDLAD